MSQRYTLPIIILLVFMAVSFPLFAPAVVTERSKAVSESLVTVGDRYFARGDYRTATKLYQAAENSLGDVQLSSQVSFRWGTSLFYLEEFDHATELFTRLRQNEVSEIQMHLLEHYLGYGLIRLGRLSEAAAILKISEENLEEVDAHAEVGLALAGFLAEAGDQNGVLQVYDIVYRAAGSESTREGIVRSFRERIPGITIEALKKAILEKRIQRPSGGILVPWLKSLVDEGQSDLAGEVVQFLVIESDDLLLRQELYRIQLRPEERTPQRVEKIGVMLPLTGDYQFFGRKLLQAVKLAREKHQDQALELVVRDTRGDPETGRQEAFDLIDNEGVLAILGPIISAVADEVAGVGDLRKIPVLSPAAQMPGLPALHPYFFRNCLTLDQQARYMAQTAVLGMGATSFAIMSPDDNYGKSLSSAFWNEVLALGGEVLYSAEYGMDKTDFSPEIKTLKGEEEVQKIEEEKSEEEEENFLPQFDAIYIPDTYNRVGLIAPQLSFHDIDQEEVLILGGSGLNTPDLVKVGEEYVEGIIFLDGFFINRQEPDIRDFVTRYRLKYGENPDVLAAQAYDAAQIVFSLIRQGLILPEEIHRGLASLKDFPGVCGLTSMSNEGESIRDPVLITVFRGQLVELKMPLSPVVTEMPLSP